MVLCDAEDEDGEAREEKKECSNTGWSDWKDCPEYYHAVSMSAEITQQQEQFQSECSNSSGMLDLTGMPVRKDDGLDECYSQENRSGGGEAPLERRL